jgi:hypothetical protein
VFTPDRNVGPARIFVDNDYGQMVASDTLTHDFPAKPQEITKRYKIAPPRLVPPVCPLPLEQTAVGLERRNSCAYM